MEKFLKENGKLLVKMWWFVRKCECVQEWGKLKWFDERIKSGRKNILEKHSDWKLNKGEENSGGKLRWKMKVDLWIVSVGLDGGLKKREVFAVKSRQLDDDHVRSIMKSRNNNLSVVFPSNLTPLSKNANLFTLSFAYSTYRSIYHFISPWFYWKTL